jgi:hypothetical protein
MRGIAAQCVLPQLLRLNLPRPFFGLVLGTSGVKIRLERRLHW